MKMRTIALSAFLLLLASVLTGCFQGDETSENDDIDPPPESETVESDANQANEPENEGTADENDQDKEQMTTATQLFLMDSDGMVAPQVLDVPLPESKEVAAQALEYLIKDGPVSNHLPNGFQAVLPAGTEIIDLNLKEDGTMIVNASKEIENYEADKELEVLQAMTYTLTQFDDVNRVQLWVEGEPQEEMPVDGTPIENGYSRANGINIQSAGTGDFVNQEAVTVFYPAMQNDKNYFVPVTKHIETTDEDRFESLIDAVIEGPEYTTNLMQVFNDNTNLSSEPKLKDGVLEVVFNPNVLQDEEAGVISDQVMESLVRTLTEQKAVESVDVKVEDMDQIVNENKEPYTDPVTSSAFTPKQKM